MEIIRLWDKSCQINIKNCNRDIVIYPCKKFQEICIKFIKNEWMVIFLRKYTLKVLIRLLQCITVLKFTHTARKMNLSIKGFFGNCGRAAVLHLLQKSLIENLEKTREYSILRLNFPKKQVQTLIQMQPESKFALANNI